MVYGVQPCFDSVFHDFRVNKVETTSCKIELWVQNSLNAEKVDRVWFARALSGEIGPSLNCVIFVVSQRLGYGSALTR